jgi:hypothetical protein
LHVAGDEAICETCARRAARYFDETNQPFTDAEWDRAVARKQVSNTRETRPPAAEVATAKATGRVVRCSFCGQSDEDADLLLTAPGARICDTCIGLASAILADRQADRERVGGPVAASVSPSELA